MACRSPVQRQAITGTSAGILLIGSLGTKLSDNLLEIHHFYWRKCAWKCRVLNCRPCCPWEMRLARYEYSMCSGISRNLVCIWNDIILSTFVIPTHPRYSASLMLFLCVHWVVSWMVCRKTVPRRSLRWFDKISSLITATHFHWIRQLEIALVFTFPGCFCQFIWF